MVISSSKEVLGNVVSNCLPSVQEGENNLVTNINLSKLSPWVCANSFTFHSFINPLCFITIPRTFLFSLTTTDVFIAHVLVVLFGKNIYIFFFVFSAWV
jgi:hypothetical protein